MIEYKYFVFKKEDAFKYLTEKEKQNLSSIMSVIRTGRILDNKSARNNYAVINLDEPYADEIIEIMKKHGHWDSGGNN